MESFNNNYMVLNAEKLNYVDQFDVTTYANSKEEKYKELSQVNSFVLQSYQRKATKAIQKMAAISCLTNYLEQN